MVSLQNIQILKRFFPQLLSDLNNSKIDTQKNVSILKAKSNVEIIEFETEGKKYALHSIYDPIREAKLLIKGLVGKLDSYEHVFFYGVGLGYHIEYFIDKYPTKTVTICEPRPEVLSKMLATKSIHKIARSVQSIILDIDEDKVSKILRRLVYSSNGSVLLVVLPSYERAFSEQTNRFVNNFKKIVSNRRVELSTNFVFQRRWTLNSIKNLEKSITTPNILEDFCQCNFKQKPVLIVSAGPSLEEEMENIRFLKENKLAYIFAVGSSINTLLNNGIHPDAACTYDPQQTNHLVFEKIVSNNIITIPLIYGTSVGFETIERYPGPMAHFFTNQDKVAPYYLKKEVDDQINMIADAPSIAVITLQMVCKMGFNPVILVGQNLAYLGDKSYADGSKRSGISTSIDKKALEESILIENVYGEKIYTSKGFNSMREDMEKYISLYKTVRVINTTKGGARIAGAEFIELDQVISLYCKEKVVDEKWFPEKYKDYQEDFLLKQINNMEKQAEDLVDIFGKITEILNAIEKRPKSAIKIQNLFEKFDRHTDRLRRNHFYNVFLMPMNRVQIHLFEQSLEVVRSEKNIFNQAAMLADSYRNCFDSCKEDFQVVYPLVLKMHQELKEKVKNGGNS